MKTGTTFTAHHPQGLYMDNVTGMVYTETYKVTANNLNDCFGDIEITKIRNGVKSIIENEWFNQRTITIILNP